MLYSDFITKLRRELRDFERVHRGVFDGDDSTTIFSLNYVSVKDASYTVKIGGVVKTEGTDYSLDKYTGIVTFATAPASGSDNIEITYKSIKFRDEDYVEIINDGIDHFRWVFWKMDTDETALTTVKNQYEYDCSGITGILYVINAWYKASSGSTVWQAIQGLTNWKYYTRLIKLSVNPTFSNSSLPIKLLYLRSLTKGTAISDTIDIPDEWILPYKYYVYARYYERQIPERINETAAVTTLPSYAPSQVVFSIAENYYKKADEVARKIAPKLPSISIKQIHDGITL